MGIKLKHGGTISGGAQRGKNAPQMNDASRAETGGHFITAQAVVGRANAPSPGGGGGGGHAPLVSAPHGASMISAPPVSNSRGGTRLGGKGKGLPGSSSSSSALGGKGGITSTRSTTGYGPQLPPPDFEVTGYDPRVRPDRHSVWNPQTAQWERGKVAYQNWLGGMGDERRGDLAAEADERKFTEAQRREAEQLNAVYERARKSGAFYPEELARVKADIEARKAGIQPLSQLPQPSAQEQFDQRVVTAGGRQGYINSKGDFVPFESGGVTPEMWNKWEEYESRVKVRTTDEAGQETFRERTPEEIQAALEAREARFMKRFGPKQPEAPAEPGVTDVTNSPRGTGTITTVDGRTVSTGDLPGRGTISITQNGKTTTTTVDDIMRNPKMIENLKEHWSVGAGMNPEAKPAPSAAEPSGDEAPADASAAAGEQKPKPPFHLLDLGRDPYDPDQLPKHAASRSGGNAPSSDLTSDDGPSEEIAEVVEEAPPPKKEKKDDE